VKVPFLDLCRRNTELEGSFQKAMNKVLKEARYINGPEVSLFEEALGRYLGRSLVACASGTDALLLSLMHLGVGPGDEVVVPALTFIATAGSPARLGARVKFADVNEDSFNIEPASLEKLLSPKTKAVIAVNLYGQAADYEALNVLEAHHNFNLVEDAAQSLGGHYRQQKLGTLSPYGCLSFFHSKSLGALGDGGAIVVDAKEVAALKSRRQHGGTNKYFNTVLGTNSRLDTFQAAFLLEQLPFLDTWIQSRRDKAAVYDKGLEDLEQRELLRLPRDFSGGGHSYNQYVVRVMGGRRDALKEHLKANNIDSMIYYPKSLNQQAVFQSFSPQACPQAEKLCREILALPISPWLTEKEQAYVIENINVFLKEK
jgi:dTDP-4-amino-4,6-dideoxygalactose transaminase